METLMRMTSLGATPIKATNAPAAEAFGTAPGQEGTQGLSFPSLLSRKQAEAAPVDGAVQAPGESPQAAGGQDAIAAQLAGLMAIATARIETPAAAEAKASLTPQEAPAEPGEAADPKQIRIAQNGAPLVQAAGIAKSATGETAAQAAAAGEDETGEAPVVDRAAGWKLELTGTQTAPAAAKAAPNPTATAPAAGRPDDRPLAWQAVTPSAEAVEPTAAEASAPKAEVAASAAPDAKNPGMSPGAKAETLPPATPRGATEAPAADIRADEESAAVDTKNSDQDAAPTADPAPAAAVPAHGPVKAAAAPQQENHAQAETGDEPLHGGRTPAPQAGDARAFESAFARAETATVRTPSAPATQPQASQAGSVRSQVIQQVALQARPGNGPETMTLQLNPEHLGQVEIRFTSQDDQLQVVITASGTDAERALREGVRELAEGIVERSGRWQHVDVKVELKDPDQKRQERGSSDGDAKQEQGGGRHGSSDQGERQPRQGDENAAWQWAETGAGE